MPVLRYFLCVGSVLLAALFAVGESESTANKSNGTPWTSTDSLRSSAHHGEPKIRTGR